MNRIVALFACVALLCAARPASARSPFKYVDFEDMVRCQFIIDEVCARLKADDLKGALAFMGAPESGDFRELPDDQGKVRSCRRVKPSPGLERPKEGVDMTLLLGYASGKFHEVGLRFGRIAPWTCGYISEISLTPNMYVKDGRRYYSFHIATLDEDAQDRTSIESRMDLIARVQPEKDDSPRSAYMEKVLAQIRAVRESGREEKDPLKRPLIEKD